MRAIINAEIETITNGRISSGTIVFDESGIKAVGMGVVIPEGACVFDAKGRTVTPGIIEAHSRGSLRGRFSS